MQKKRETNEEERQTAGELVSARRQISMTSIHTFHFLYTRVTENQASRATVLLLTEIL